MDTYKQIRKHFLATEKGRYDLTVSHVRNEVLYSTDARSVLCEPVPGVEDSPGEFPDAAGVLHGHGFPGILESDGWSTDPLPAPPDEPKQTCPDCYGAGWLQPVHPRDTSEPLGGEVECPRCDAMGTVGDGIIVVTPKNWFSASNLWKVSLIPGLQWRLSGPDGFLLFKGDEGVYGVIAWVDSMDKETALHHGLLFYEPPDVAARAAAGGA